MAHRELYTRLNPGKVQAVAPALAHTTVESAAIDLAEGRGYGSALVIYNMGAEGDTLSGSVKMVGTLTECDTTGGSYTDVAAADIAGTLPTIDANGEAPAIHVVAYIGAKRFLKVGWALTGTHTVGTIMAVTVLRGHSQDLE